MQTYLDRYQNHNGFLFADRPTDNRPTRRRQQALSLPMSRVEPAAAALSILVIEDESTLRRLMQKALTLDGHQIEAACDGRQGLAQYDMLRPDLIVLDVNMPHVDGLTVLREIRRQDPVVGIILVSALKQEALAEAAESGRADGYLQKPFRLPILRQEIQRVSALVHLRRFRGKDE